MIPIPTPSEILATPGYDPAEHIFAVNKKRNIATVPDRDDILLRWYPHDSYSEVGVLDSLPSDTPVQASLPPSVDMLQALHGSYEANIARLRSCGVSVVAHTVEVVEINPTYKPDMPTLFAVVQKLSGSELRGRDNRGAATVEGLKHYYESAADTDVIFDDIFKPWQYTLSTNGTSRTPVLHDIEPIMRRPTRRHANQLRAWLADTQRP